ncbi:MAG: phage holin family protein [Clostridium sp.]|nr:phage holin family protein [Clostridium sp.]MDU6345108.1 phage holin family protein [Clostridium sp.]
MILFFIANEGFSVIENLGIMGVPMPPVVKNAFAAIKSKAEKNE